MSSDERVRQALHGHAHHIEPGEGSWERIQGQVQRVRRRRRRWAAGATGAVAAAVLAAVAVVSLGGDGDHVVRSGPAATTVAPPPNRPAPGPGPEPEDLASPFPGIWPLHSDEELGVYLDSASTQFEDPSVVARKFAIEYLGMIDPVVGDASDLGPDGDVPVTVQPRGENGQTLPPGVMETVVHLDPDGPPWQVLYTTSTNIRLDGPTWRNDVRSPLALSGEGTASEGTVQVEVRQAGMEAGQALGSTVVTAGAQGTLAPFATEVDFDPPTTEGFGALVLSTESAVDGSTLEATVVALSFSTETDQSTLDETQIEVFFHRAEELEAVSRSVPATTEVLRASLDALFAGPTPAERANGLSSILSAETAGALRDVTIGEGGRVVVDLADLRPIIPNASTSAGSDLLLGQLNATVFQFSTVTSVDYRIEGRCEVFWNWLQRSCQVVERPGG